MFTEFESYERFMGRWSRRLAPQLVDFAGIRGEDRVLDVGTGTGVLARAIEERFPAPRFTGVDSSAAYVRHARESLAGSPARFAVADARSLPFADHSFDRCLSLIALNFVPTPEVAVGEMKRVTRPGGTVAAAVWDYADGMSMLRRFWDAAVHLDPEADSRDERHMPLSRAGELAGLWERSGLCAVEETTLIIEQEFATFDDYWSPFLLGTGPAGQYVASLGESKRAALRDHLRASLQGNGPDHPFTLACRSRAVRGRREA